MALPAPHLDDRTFQDLVDDAKRLVQQRCPEWTDHNVSDPGVTLIEAVATMVDQLIYRLNRVPERHHVRFLELIGVRLFPPVAARTRVTFWLSASQPETVLVRAGSQVATVRTETDEAVVFRTVQDLPLVSTRLDALLTGTADGAAARDVTAEVGRQEEVACFGSPPRPGDVLLVGLTDAAPSCAVLLQIRCRAHGEGVRPDDAPLRWEALTEAGWTACEVDRDTTGGLNRTGDVVLHLPAGHVRSPLDGRTAGWLRCRLVETRPGQPGYEKSPRLSGVTVCTMGGTVDAVHAEEVSDELLGVSDGTAGQRFSVQRPPVVASDTAEVLEVADDQGWAAWQLVADFAGSDATSPHFVLDRAGGELELGPVVRLPDGGLRQHGAVPPLGATLLLRRYLTGGGRRGNVGRGTLRVLKSSIPYVADVGNRVPASGGVDAETVASALRRAPLVLRSLSRAVTSEDYELLAREAAPGLARAHCLPDPEAGVVRVLLVPAVADAVDGQPRFADLQPRADMLQAVAERLDERRTIGARVLVEPPYYRGVTVVAHVRTRSSCVPADTAARVELALTRHFHPLTGGPNGTGWPFGRPVHPGEVFAALQSVPGVLYVDDVQLFLVDPATGRRKGEVDRVELAADELVYSVNPQVVVEGA